MKNNIRNIVIFSALALLISSSTKQESENKAVNMNIKLTWTVVTNMLVEESSCRAAFTIQNKSSQTIGNFGWAIYYSQIPRRVTNEPNAKAIVKHINGDWFKIIPEQGFSLATEEKLVVHYDLSHYLINETDAPLYPYIVRYDENGNETSVSIITDYKIFLECFGEVELCNYVNLNIDEKILVLNMRNHPQIKKWMSNQDDIPETSHFNFIKNLENIVDQRYFLVKQHKSIVGSINFSKVDLSSSVEFGIYTNPFAQLKGAGSMLEAVASYYAFIELGVNKIKLEVFSNNERAIGFYKKCGFELINTKKVNHKETYLCALAEREMLKVLKGDCETAVAGLATIKNKKIFLNCELFSIDGKKKFTFNIDGKKNEAKKIGHKAGLNLISQAGNSYKVNK